jgi:TRAP-type C4-dicarboxylate transport system permease small subunit
MPRGLRRLVSTAVDLIVVGVYGWFTWLCVKLAMRTQSIMVSLELPKSTIYWVVAVGFAVMTFYQLRRAVRHLRAGTNDLIDPPGI